MVQKLKLLTRSSVSDDDLFRNMCAVKCVCRLADVEHDVVGNVDDGVDGTQAGLHQSGLHPDRRFLLRVYVFDFQSGVARALVRSLNLNRELRKSLYCVDCIRQRL